MLAENKSTLIANKDILLNEDFWNVISDMFDLFKFINDSLLSCERYTCNVLTCFNTVKVIEDYIINMENRNTEYTGLKNIQVTLFKHLNRKILNVSHYLDRQNIVKLLSLDEMREV